MLWHWLLEANITNYLVVFEISRDPSNLDINTDITTGYKIVSQSTRDSRIFVNGKKITPFQTLPIKRYSLEIKSMKLFL